MKNSKILKKTFVFESINVMIKKKISWILLLVRHKISAFNALLNIKILQKCEKKSSLSLIRSSDYYKAKWDTLYYLVSMLIFSFWVACISCCSFWHSLSSLCTSPWCFVIEMTYSYFLPLYHPSFLSLPDFDHDLLPLRRPFGIDQSLYFRLCISPWCLVIESHCY